MYFSVHNHSEFSNLKLLDSINKVSTLYSRAIELGLKGFALTDHEVLSGHVQMVQQRKKLIKEKKITEDFKIALGDEIYLINDIADYRENYTSATHSYYHFLLLAKDEIGYRALKEISSLAWCNSYSQNGVQRTPTDKKDLLRIMQKYKNHIIASTACLGGELSKLILKLEIAEKRKDENMILLTKTAIHNFISFCIEAFGKENFFLEVQPSANQEQITVNKMISVLGKDYDLKVIYSTDSHYIAKEKQLIHKSYLNAMQGEREVDSFYATAYMMSEEEIYSFFKDYITELEFKEWTQNTIILSDMIENYDLMQEQIIPTVEVPFINFQQSLFDKYEFLNKMLISKSEQDNYWVNYCLKELSKKKLWNDLYLQRLDDEAKEIWLISEKLNVTMTSYYNTMKQIIDVVWNDGDSLVGPARGSATGFLSCYLLGITQMDPITWNLPFWRLSLITSLYSNI